MGVVMPIPPHPKYIFKSAEFKTRVSVFCMLIYLTSSISLKYKNLLFKNVYGQFSNASLLQNLVVCLKVTGNK